MPGRTLEEALAESGYASKPEGGETDTAILDNENNGSPAPGKPKDSPGDEPTPSPDPAPEAIKSEKTTPDPKPVDNSVTLKGIFGEEWSDTDKIKEALAKSKHDWLSDIKDPDVRELVQAASKGISKQAFDTWKQIGDLGKLSGSEKIALKLQMEKGFSPEDAKFYVDNLYKLDVDLSKIDKEHPDYASTRVAQLEGGEQARAAEAWLAAKKDELSTPPTQMQLRKWEPQIPKLVAEHGKIEISTEGMAEKFSYPLNPSKVKEMESFLKGIVENYTGFADPDSAEAIQWAAGAIQNQIFKEERDQIFSAYKGWLENQRIKDKVNPSSIKNVPGEEALTPGKKTDQDAYAEEKKKERAGVKN